jgi:hypothetical protein
MCRNIQPLFNFEPPATAEDIQAAALQYVRKISGYRKPSRANEAAFQAAVVAERIQVLSENGYSPVEANFVTRDGRRIPYFHGCEDVPGR